MLFRSVESAGAKLVGSTYLQCFWDAPEGTSGETAWCQKIADATQNQVNTAIIGEVDMLAPTSTVRAELEKHIKFKNFRGIRFCVSNDAKHRPHTHNFLEVEKSENGFAEEQFIKNLDLFAEFGLSWDAWCYGVSAGPSLAEWLLTIGSVYSTNSEA